MGFIPPHVQEYLQENYHRELTGKQLATDFSWEFSERSGRRYLENFQRELMPEPELRKAPTQTMDAVVFDIETTDFGTEGYAGRLVCCSFLPLSTGVVETIKINYQDKMDDREVLETVAKRLAQYPFHVGHNIAAFDYNWLNSRLYFHSMPGLNSAFYFDTYQVAKALALKTAKGLGNLIDYFNLEGVKTTIYRSSWSGVNSPYQHDFEQALNEIVTHCEYDVAANRRLFDRLMPLSMNNGRASAWKLTKVRGNYWK